MRKLLAILAAGFFLVSAYSFARSEECVNPFPAFVETVTAMEGGTVKPATDAERAQLIAKKGEPPITGPYTVAVARFDPGGMIVIVQGECIVTHLGPVPLPDLERFLGNSGA